MVAAKRTGVALQGASASVEAPKGGLAGVEGVAAKGAGTVLAKVAPSDTVAKPPLREGLFCCLKAQRLKVFSGESHALHQDEGVNVAVWAVVIVDGGNKLYGFAKTLF